MDIHSVKIGTIGRFHIKKTTSINPTTGDKKYTEFDICGVVTACPHEGSDTIYVVNELGRQHGFRKGELQSVSSIRITKEARAQFATIAKKHEEIQKLKQEKKKIEQKLYEINNQLKEEYNQIAHISGYYSSDEVDEKFYKCGLEIVERQNNGKIIEIVLQQRNSGTRYSKPNVSREFPFVYQEYDGCCFVNEKGAEKEYKAFLAQKAPAIIVHLAKIAEDVFQKADVSDKHIYATTNYRIRLKNGFTKENVDKLIEALKER